MFKVGDKVVRIKESHLDMMPGDIATIKEINQTGLILDKYQKISKSIHDPNNFKLADLRDIIKEIVKENKK